MSDIDNAIRHWWENGAKIIRARVLRAWRSAALDDRQTSLLMRAMRAAFIAGYHAGAIHTEASGTQRSLLDDAN